MLNLVVLMGRLTADPELRQTSNDIPFTRFSIAVQRNYAPKNGGDRETDFFSVVAWRATAEYICKYLKKGNLIVVQGSVQTGSYEKDGVKRTTFDIVASNVVSSPNNISQKQEIAASEADEDDQFIF